MTLILPADPVYRRQLAWSIGGVILVALLGLAGSLYYLKTLEVLATTDPDLAVRKMTFFFRLLTVLGMIDLSAGAIFLLWQGQRTLSHQQYPPPDTPVARDTRVRVGAQAHRCGMIHFVAGNLLLVAALAGGFLLLWHLSQPG